MQEINIQHIKFWKGISTGNSLDHIEGHLTNLGDVSVVRGEISGDVTTHLRAEH